MTTRRPSWPGFAVLSLALAFSLPSSLAQSAPASLEGRVLNVATGQFLNNARVTVQGTELVAFTDPTGTYRLAHVPPGPVVLEVFYTGLDPQQIRIEVPAGRTTQRDVELTNVARYGPPGGTVKLDAFTVSTTRETDNEAIAVNEQRFAPNIKNVVAADSLGDVMDGNIGEFLKFMPGITAEYDLEAGGAVASVSVRGFPTSMAVVSADGAQMANTGNPQGASRVFQFNQVSINNISRLEVTKVPTPSTPADSMSGSVNMVTKSSFERKNAQLRYSFSLSANSEALDLKRTPHLSDEKIWKIRPSASFDYTLPVTKNFGLVLTATSMNRYVHQVPFRKVYNATAAGTGATFARPYLQNIQFVSAPRTNARNSVGLRLDWRVTPGGVLSLNVEGGRFESDRTSVDYTFNAGTVATPTPAGGTPLSFGENFTIGATGRGAVPTMGTASVYQTLDTRAANLRYRLDHGDWRVEAGVGASTSQGGYQDTKHGRFRQLGITMAFPVRVTLADVSEIQPGRIEVYNNANQRVNPFDPTNYVMNTANSTPRYIDDHMKNARLDLRRNLSGLRIPLTLQLGSSYRSQTRDVRRESINWTYNGPDGNPATPDSPAPYQMTTYVGQDDGYGFKNIPWISEYKVWSAYQANPNLFGQTPAQVVAAETFRINNSEWLQESVSALYLQGEAGFFKNRLKLLTGVRYEKTETEGLGVSFDPAAVFVRTANGAFARNAAGARIRKPEAGAAGSMQELQLIRHERAQSAARTYDGYYPSLHLTYSLKENFLIRAAYARTYGRPDFTEIVPNTNINETDLDEGTADPSILRGRITVRNTGLRPWTGDNYDLSAEYYTDQGGLFSAGVFRKEIKDFFGEAVRLATAADLEELDLDPRYVGWQITTQYNLPGAARVTGMEFNVRHSLRPLGAWGRYFQAFVNGTKLELEGSQDADFLGFIPESANWGLNARWKRFGAVLNWNHRGKQKRGAMVAVNGYEYITARTTLDLSMDYQLSSRFTLYGNAQNVFNEPETAHRYGPDTPHYAKHHRETKHGVQITLGVKGSF
jgi:iron complex outermembrane receptor protein